MSRSSQLDSTVLPTRLFMGGHITESQLRKLSTLRHKRMSEPRSVATIQHRENNHARESRSTRKNETLYSPYRTFEKSEKKLTTIQRHQSRTEDKSNNSTSRRKMQTKSLSSNAKLNFRLRVYNNPFARRFSKAEQLKPQQMTVETATVYEKLFRRRKYGLQPTPQKLAHVVSGAHHHIKSPVAAAPQAQPLDSEQDQISKNYIKNEIFMFQNESLEFGYDDEPAKKEVFSSLAPPGITSKQSTDKKKNFRRNKYEQPAAPPQFQTIQQPESKSPSLRGGRESVIDNAEIIPDELSPLKRTIESHQSRSDVHA